VINGILGKFVSKYIGGDKSRLNYAAGAFWLFVEKGIKFLAELLVGFYLARHLGAEKFGLLNFAVSYVILFQGISTLGFNEILVRELMHYQNQRSAILSTALLLRFAASFFFIFCIQLFAIPFDMPSRVLVFIISLSIFFRSFEIFTPYFQSVVKAEQVAFVQIAITVIGSALKILFIRLGSDLTYFAWVYTAEWLLLGAGLYTIYRINRNDWKWTFRKNWSMRLLKNSWYLMLSAAAVNLYMRLDQVMIRQMVDDSANGFYSAAVRLSEIWYILPTILCAILFPAILNARKKDTALYNVRMEQLNAFLFWLALIISVTLAPFSDELIVLLYGAEYAPAGIVLKYHIWSSIFVFFGVSSGYWLIAEKFEKVSLYRTLAGLSINLVLNFLLIPRYGIVGAAVATLIGQITASVICMLLIKRTRGIIFIQAKSIFYPFKQLYRIFGQ
jgi:O-antigen/teichoic acid export membrane protein